MATQIYRNRLILPIAPAAGGALGLGFALAVAVMPQGLLVRAVDASRLPDVLAVAAPPLGPTARALLVLGGGGGLALLAGLALYLVYGRRTVAIGRRSDDGIPVLRRADAHPDAPARAPVRAHRDLGAPLLGAPLDPEEDSDLLVIERGVALPRDLDQPLAAFDPEAILPTPREPVRPVPPLIRQERPQLIDPGDRFETFEPAADLAERQGESVATLHALLDRLERSVGGTGRPPAPTRASAGAVRDLHNALGALHNVSSDAA
ncbi:MAG: hypothetical protein ACTHMG_08355 [Sphingomonas sp.]